MAIVFSQPGPFLADASIGAGEAQQYSRDQAGLIAQQKMIAELYARQGQGGGGGAHLPQRPAPAGPGSFGVGGQQMQAPSYAPPPREDPLTQAEVLRLQRLQMAQSTVDEQVQNGSLTPEEGNQFRLQLRTGIDPLMQRQRAAQTAALNEQTQQQMHQHAQLVSMQDMSTQQLAQHAARFVQPIYDDEGEVTGRIHFDPMTGRSTYHETRPERTGRDRQEITPQMRQQAIRHVEGAMQREEANVATPPAWMGGEAGTREQRREQERARRLRRHLEEITGGGQGGRPAAGPGGLPAVGDVNAAVDAVAGRFAGGRGGGGESATDPGMVSMAPPAASAVRGIGQDVGNFVQPWNRFGAGDVFEELRHAPRPEGPQHPNTPAGVPMQALQRASQIALRAWNDAEFRDRANNPLLKQIGRAYEMMQNAIRNRRSLTRHELAHYRRLLEGLQAEDQHNLALVPVEASRGR